MNKLTPTLCLLVALTLLNCKNSVDKNSSSASSATEVYAPSDSDLAETESTPPDTGTQTQDALATNAQRNATNDTVQEWTQPTHIAYQTSKADVVYRYGDVDNFGFGWPPGFDPFSGEDTPVHRYPFFPDETDPAGTDRIMVISGYKKSNRKDGYTGRTQRPENLPKPLLLQYDLRGTQIEHALLQIFVDDFQPKRFKSKYKVWLNDKETPWISEFVNELEQTGPIGKLLSVQILPEFLSEVKTGQLKLFIDDPETDTGDGFAIDFVQLLINPRDIPTARMEGLVIDATTKEPLENALVKISGVNPVKTDADGRFTAEKVPAGMIVVNASKGGYKNNDVTETITANNTGSVTIPLEPETGSNLEQELEETGKVSLYGIYFDSDKALLKAESEKTLQEVLALIQRNPERSLEIGGHTDSQGDDAYNLKLSEERAKAVLDWLKANGANTNRLTSKGYGETVPVATNNTENGRALNRRVELLVK